MPEQEKARAGTGAGVASDSVAGETAGRSEGAG